MRSDKSLLREWGSSLFVKFFLCLSLTSLASTLGIIAFNTLKNQFEIRRTLGDKAMMALDFSRTSQTAYSKKGNFDVDICRASMELLVHRIYGVGALAHQASNSFADALAEGRIAAVYSGIGGQNCKYPQNISNDLQRVIISETRKAHTYGDRRSYTFESEAGWISLITVRTMDDADAILAVGVQALDTPSSFSENASQTLSWLWPYMIVSNLCVSLLLVFFLFRRIRHAEQVAGAWAHGQLNIRINDERGDEFGRLAQRFDHMADALVGVIEAKQAIAAQNERSRLARELHDTAKQRCFALGLQLSLLRRLCSAAPEHSKLASSALKLVEHLQQDMGNVIQRLSAPTVAELGLDNALRENLTTLFEGSDIDWSVDIQPAAMDWLRKEDIIATELLLISGEAATNALRHGRASKLSIHLTKECEVFILRIKDNGQGFDLNESSSGMGLGNMRQRTDSLPNSHIVIVSEVGMGTSITITINPV